MVSKREGTNGPLKAYTSFMGVGWKERLRQAVKADGRSPREISLAAGLAHNYVWKLFNTDMVPNIDTLMSIIGVLEISLGEIVEGYTLDKDSRELLTIWGDLSPAEREHLELLLKALLASRSKGP